MNVPSLGRVRLEDGKDNGGLVGEDADALRETTQLRESVLKAHALATIPLGVEREGYEQIPRC
jgi:hypothetical protein